MTLTKGLIAPIILTACLTAGASAADKSPVEARKDLGTMGLSYSDPKQFLEAWKRNDQIAVDLFLAAKGFDVNVLSGQRLWEQAYKEGKRELAEKLLTAGYVIAPADLVAVIARRDMETMRALTAAPGFRKEAIGLSVLAKAIDTKDLEVLKYLVGVLGPQASARVNATAVSGLGAEGGQTGARRLLNYGIEYGTREAVEYLIGIGADVNAVDPRMMRIKPAGLLATAGLNEHLKKVPETPLMTAARSGRDDLIEVLLGAGANPNVLITQEKYWAQTYDKHTALSYARQAAEEAKDAGRKARIERVIEVLVRSGAKDAAQQG